MAYVAALAVGAPLVFGDRPKSVTFARLLASGDAATLDAAFGAQAAAYYAEVCGAAPAAFSSDDAFEVCVMQERDALLYTAMRREAQQAGPDASIVGIVGSAHLEALSAAFAAAQQPLDPSLLLTAPPPPDASGLGARQALLERLLALRCPAEALTETLAGMAELPEVEAATFAAVREVYGSARMLLAVLPPEQLARIACGLGSDFYAQLAPLRELRFLRGGPGFTSAAIDELRQRDWIERWVR